MIDVEKFEQETWSLDFALAGIILPKLLWYKNFTEEGTTKAPTEFYVMDDDYSIYLKPGESYKDGDWKKYSLIDEWEEVLDAMIWSFQAIISEEYDYFIELKAEHHERIQYGLHLFAKYFQHLWL